MRSALLSMAAFPKQQDWCVERLPEYEAGTQTAWRNDMASLVEPGVNRDWMPKAIANGV